MPVASFGPERLVTLRQLYCWRKAREGAVRGLTPGRDPSHRVSGCRYIGKGGRGVTCGASERIAQRQGCRITAELGSRDQPGVGLLPIAEVTPSCAPSPASCQLQVEAHCGLTAGPSGRWAADEDRSCYGIRAGYIRRRRHGGGEQGIRQQRPATRHAGVGRGLRVRTRPTERTRS